MVDVAIEGLAQSVDESCHAAMGLVEMNYTNCACFRIGSELPCDPARTVGYQRGAVANGVGVPTSAIAGRYQSSLGRSDGLPNTAFTNWSEPPNERAEDAPDDRGQQRFRDVDLIERQRGQQGERDCHAENHLHRARDSPDRTQCETGPRRDRPNSRCNHWSATVSLTSWRELQTSQLAANRRHSQSLSADHGRWADPSSTLTSANGTTRLAVHTVVNS